MALATPTLPTDPAGDLSDGVAGGRRAALICPAKEPKSIKDTIGLK